MRPGMKKLEERIDIVFGSRPAFCKVSGITESTLSRLIGGGDWKVSQMRAAIEALRIADKDIASYFFTDDCA